MRRHRTTARGVLLILAIGLFAGSAAAHTGGLGDGEGGTGPVTKPAPVPKPKPKKPSMIFPVVGPVQYTDDFGAPRAHGTHQGNDIMAARKSPAVAAEAGRVKFWTHSASAGCMLYLYGKSGTTYLYIHLNNDVTMRNDNRGRCGPGMSYAPGLKDGQKVAAGQLIGFVGDSGDANGVATHLHFEVHPHDGAAVSPYRYLNRASRLLFAVLPKGQFTLSLSGKLVSTTSPDGLTATVKMNVRTLRAWPGGFRVGSLGRNVTVTVDENASIFRQRSGPSTAAATVALDALTSAKKGQRVVVKTAPAKQSLDAKLGRLPFGAASVTLLPKR
jgi:hypothetical protein